MKRALPVAAAAMLAISLLIAPAGVATAAPIPSPPSADAPAVPVQIHADRVCAIAPAGSAACDALIQVGATGRAVGNATPRGLVPADIRSAYVLNSSSGNRRTVAIVDAFDAPTAEADLAVYRTTFGLPACTTANGCFRKVGQTGGAVPVADGGWAQEISLDLDMVSATCPDCRILLVEATSASFADLGAAVDYAASQGVSAISNSYGGMEAQSVASYDHPGIAITASTGDGGYGVSSPASFPSVVAVGGTSLTRSSTTRGWTEAAWSGAGSGCSLLNSKPSWQTAATQCVGKGVADVSAVADPSTGVAVYDSTAYQGAQGWLVFGGTSVSSPIIASVYALSGNTAGYPASYTWANARSLNDVTTGSNGICVISVWCNSGAGWDGPTGLGTPIGTAAF